MSSHVRPCWPGRRPSGAQIVARCRAHAEQLTAAASDPVRGAVRRQQGQHSGGLRDHLAPSSCDQQGRGQRGGVGGGPDIDRAPEDSSRRPISASTASAPATTSSAAGVRPGPSPITPIAGAVAAVSAVATANASDHGRPNDDAGSPSTVRAAAAVTEQVRGGHPRTRFPPPHRPPGAACRRGHPLADPGIPRRSGSWPAGTPTPSGKRTAHWLSRASTTAEPVLAQPDTRRPRWRPERTCPAAIGQQVADGRARPGWLHHDLRFPDHRPSG